MIFNVTLIFSQTKIGQSVVTLFVMTDFFFRLSKLRSLKNFNHFHLIDTSNWLKILLFKTLLLNIILQYEIFIAYLFIYNFIFKLKRFIYYAGSLQCRHHQRFMNSVFSCHLEIMQFLFSLYSLPSTCIII